ncbi:hypothetical protein E2C01_029447 [Portunus trituberculatus]|uniref:Uncharacterized protein n=1 Tax=Portunus trituberculatus TaxID=210409 RepID=A0A5B7EUL8_PORTR|nr:hypothetical protein [Portunus trituberculatus]
MEERKQKQDKEGSLSAARFVNQGHGEGRKARKKNEGKLEKEERESISNMRQDGRKDTKARRRRKKIKRKTWRNKSTILPVSEKDLLTREEDQSPSTHSPRFPSLQWAVVVLVAVAVVVLVLVVVAVNSGGVAVVI